MKARVAIVGAGASGLQCARDLIQSNLFLPDDIIILEARDRIGGRIYSTDEIYIPQTTNGKEIEADLSVTTAATVDVADSVPITATIHSKPIKYTLDHGAAWVHGLGIDWGESMENYAEKSKPFANPMMELLQEEVELTERNNSSSSSSGTSVQENQQQTVFTKHLYNTVCGNPWMRPYRVLHEPNDIAVFVDGQSIPNDSVLVRYAVDRHYAILKKISDLGNELLKQQQEQHAEISKLNGDMDHVDDCDNEALNFSIENTSFHDMIVHVQEKYKDCLLSLLSDEKKYNTLSANEIELVQQTIVPFYIHLIECWYGASATKMRFYEFVVESEDEEEEQQDPNEQKRREPWVFDGISATAESTSGSCDSGHSDGNYVGQGDFYGSHATMQNGMRSLLTPLVTNNGLLERIYLNNEVIRIERKNRHITLDDQQVSGDSTSTSQSNNDSNSMTIEVTTRQGLIVQSDYCIVTIPAGCLNEKLKTNKSSTSIECSSNTSTNDATTTSDVATTTTTLPVVVDTPPPLPPFFVPSLSKNKIDALLRMEMSPYKKVFLTFDRIFWPSKPAFLGLILSNATNNNVNHTTGRSPLGNYLLVDNLWARRGIPSFEGLLYSQSGTWATHKSDDVIVETVLQFVSNSLGIPYKNIRDMYCTHHITRWEEDPYSYGAFTAMTVGATEEHKKELNIPEWDDTLYISGEATIEDYEGCVHSALWSGTNVAKRIINVEENRRRN